jgi:hypothetical protein
VDLLRARPEAAAGKRSDWIPILGRSAAGLPQFWSPTDQAEGQTKLRDLIDSRAAEAPQSICPGELGLSLPSDAPGPASPGPVQIVTLDQAHPDGIAEFIDAERLHRRWPNAVAVRIDGESMAPDIRHGDLVILSPSVAAEDGRPAVVQLRGQIGVTCKLYRRSAGTVHLIPANETFPPQVFPAEDVVWALRVVARIRPAAHSGS